MHKRLSSKFQVVIPKRARKRWGLRPRSPFTVIERDEMLVLIPKITLNPPGGIPAGTNPDDSQDRRDLA